MRTSTLFFATILGLALIGCTPDYTLTPTQAGGSGDEFGYQAPYAGRDGRGCSWDDRNCRALYDDPGGGD